MEKAASIVVLVGLAAFIAAKTNKGSAFIEFAKEARTEVRKVVWPTRQETMQTTIIVMVATLIVALLLWGLDSNFIQPCIIYHRSGDLSYVRKNALVCSSGFFGF